MNNSKFHLENCSFLGKYDHLTLRYNADHNIVLVLINRPKQLNALNISLIEQLSKLFVLAEDNDSIRSIIISGTSERAFVAGADIKEFKSFSKLEAINLSRSGKDNLFNRITYFKKPVIAAINGYALGGGLELALSCHIRIATNSAKLGLPECNLGIIPGYNGTQMLPKIIGKNVALEMILSGKMISADRALSLGLINQKVESDQLIFQSLEMAASFNKSSKEAVAAAIRSVNSCYSLEGEDLETQEFAGLFETENYKEGIQAFIEKRKPNFK